MDKEALEKLFLDTGIRLSERESLALRVSRNEGYWDKSSEQELIPSNCAILADSVLLLLKIVLNENKEEVVPAEKKEALEDQAQFLWDNVKLDPEGKVINKIELIKLVRHKTNSGLKEAKDFVDATLD